MRKVIDVSDYNGHIDWKKVKESGIEGAILKIVRKDLNRTNSLRATGPAAGRREFLLRGCITILTPLQNQKRYTTQRECYPFWQEER